MNKQKLAFLDIEAEYAEFLYKQAIIETDKIIFEIMQK